MDTPTLAPKEKQIGPYTYRVEPLGFIDGRKAFVRLANLIGPALASLEKADAPDPAAITQEKALGVFTDAIGKLLSGLKDEDLAYFEGLFKGRTTVIHQDGREQVLAKIMLANPAAEVFVDHFAGKNFLNYFLWLGFCLEATYVDFFGGAWSKLAVGLHAGKVAASPSISRPASNGTSGD